MTEIGREIYNEGKAEGIAEGKAEGIAELLASHLEQKFPKLDDDIKVRLYNLNPEKIKGYALIILKMDTVEKIRAYLNRIE